MINRGCSNSRGFTLVEVLVVLFIIALLAGIITPAVHYARIHADKKVCRQEITRLCLAIENFAEEDKFAEWPPLKLEAFGITGENDINQGIESLVVCLATRRSGPHFDFNSDRFKNMDEDSGPEKVLKESLRLPFPDCQLREYVDLWNNPYIYFPFRFYGKPAKYLNSEGEEFIAQMTKDEETGMWPAPLKFVIWSCGPNGVNENGGGDDIASWH